MSEYTNGIERDIRDFLSKYIDSLEELEVLLLLRSERQRAWTIELVNERIRSSMSSVTNRLVKLEASGFVVRNTSATPELFEYKPPNAELERIIDRLAEAYRKSRMRVVEIIFSKPLNDIRSFSEAFKIRGKKEDG